MAYRTLCRQQSLQEGEMVAFEIQGHEFIVLWPEADEPRAYAGACPHQGVPLRRGFFNGRTLTCPLHQWVFDGRDGLGQNAGCRLKSYPLRVRDGMVEVDHPGFSGADSHGH